MIYIYRDGYDSVINVFHGRPWVRRAEVVIKTKNVYGKIYRYAEPATPGNYTYGGTILCTSNGIYPDFLEPVKLHDRDMNQE
ncbi:MAG: hypothetical protein A2Y38_24605 [Spirochaetes bacterium GWB1_59_5]|nr:MAG: hypothetical protein A2Y38_24605 [Spirochaetes bacterium GWB1_59_5]